MQDKVIVSKYIGIDMPYWLCLMFGMPMIFFLGGFCPVVIQHQTGLEVMISGLSKGMFYSYLLIALLYICAKKF